jgi:hypothetical protein
MDVHPVEDALHMRYMITAIPPIRVLRNQGDWTWRLIRDNDHLTCHRPSGRGPDRPTRVAEETCRDGIGGPPSRRVAAVAIAVNRHPTAMDTHSFFDYGDNTQVAFQSHLFYPAWSDSTGTNPDGKLHQVDLYTARMRIP